MKAIYSNGEYKGQQVSMRGMNDGGHYYKTKISYTSSTVKKHVFRKWLHAEHIDACSGWKTCDQRFKVMRLRNSKN